MLNAAIFAIGEEILDGSIVDTNSSFIAKKLLNIGVNVKTIRALPDNLIDIVSELREAVKSYPLVITTGGLGPTFDDLTAEAVSMAAGVGAKLNKEAFDHIKKRLAGYNLELNDGHTHQATLPENAVLIQNNHGTAMGFMVEFDNGAYTVSLPGVPFEMKPMFTDYAVDMIRSRFNLSRPYICDMRFIKIPESDVDMVIKSIGIPSSTKCIINAGVREVTVRVRDMDFQVGSKFADSIKSKLENFYFSSGEESLADAVINILKMKKFTLSVAESCTGGLLGGSLSSVPGASEAFYGGVISYDNVVKMNQLKVSQDILTSYGAVSSECAAAMAEGVKNLLSTDCTISVTGIAGPDGGSDEKPVGTVFIGICANGETTVKKYRFYGGREDVRNSAVKSALMDLYLRLI